MTKDKLFSKINVEDISAGFIVFLVALPLCLGISLASGAPLISGLITGIIGGLVIPLISNSRYSVSGPAAGLTVIVLSSISILGGFDNFLFAIFIAGLIQIVLGLIKAGNITAYIPSSVIKGMLAAIGVILILKQIPHAVGYDKDYEGDFEFFQSDSENTFTEIMVAISKINIEASIIFLVSLFILIFWQKKYVKTLSKIPAGLIAVLVGISINQLFDLINFDYSLRAEHLVQLPIISNLNDIVSVTPSFDFNLFTQFTFWRVVFTLAIVASLETLLSIEAVDKIDPEKHTTNTNKELIAQGVGNTIAGLLGGLPMTSVIVRSSANISAGAKTKLSAMIHSSFLLLALLAIPSIINMIPLSSLAAILIFTGAKLCSVKIFKQTYKNGKDQFILFVITLLSIIFTDLLIGVGIGVSISYLYILYTGAKLPFSVHRTKEGKDNVVRISLSEHVSYLSKAALKKVIENVKDKSKIIIDGSKTKYIDNDVLELIEDYKLHFKTQKDMDTKNNFVLQHIEKKYELSDISKHNHTEETYERLFENNRNWVRERLSQDPDYFNKLSRGQSPKYLFIGCSDSRVPANEITGTEAGEMFVHRNIANMVVHTDVNLMSVLQYAIEVLKVEHVIVCGHYGCGGVKAAVGGEYHGLVDKWLRNIKDVYRTYYDELEQIIDTEERHRKFVELNVREQVYNLTMTSFIQKAWKNTNQLHVHGWVYDIKEGLLKDLNIDVEAEFKEHKLYKYNVGEDFIANNGI